MLVLPSTLESVSLAVDAAEVAGTECGLSSETVSRISLAVAEAVANAIEHGNQGIASREVTVSFSPEAESLCIRVADSGHGIEASQLERASLPSNPLDVGGRGLYLIRELSDHVEASGASLYLCFSDRT